MFGASRGISIGLDLRENAVIVCTDEEALRSKDAINADANDADAMEFVG